MPAILQTGTPIGEAEETDPSATSKSTITPFNRRAQVLCCKFSWLISREVRRVAAGMRANFALGSQKSSNLRAGRPQFAGEISAE